MRKIILFLIMVSFVFPAFSNGGTDGATPLVALVTDTGGIDDKSFNQGTWEGVKRFADEQSLNKKQYTFLQSNSDADYIPNLSTVSDEGYKLIIAPGFLFVDAVSEVSKNYPDTHYLVIDTVVADRSNVVSAVFAEEQGSFLVGVAAGLRAQEMGATAVGFIGGIDFDVIQRFESGFEEGVAAVSPNITVMVEYVGSFSDPQKGQTIASKLYDSGAGIIFVAAGSTGNGVIKEAKDRVIQGNDVWVVGVDKDQYAEGYYDDAKSKSVILTSMLKRVDVAAYDVMKQEMEGKFAGGTVLKFDIKNNGVGIPEVNPNLTDEQVKTILSYRDKVIDGSMTISTLPKRLQ